MYKSSIFIPVFSVKRSATPFIAACSLSEPWNIIIIESDAFLFPQLVNKDAANNAAAIIKLNFFIIILPEKIKESYDSLFAKEACKTIFSIVCTSSF